MAYYPIKCPYCLQELSNHDVKFDLRIGTIDRTRDIPDDPTIYDSEVDPNIPDYMKDIDSATSNGSSTPSQSRSGDLPTEGFFTYTSLRRIFGNENITPILENSVYAPPAFANKPEYRDDLLVGVTIVTRRAGKELTTTYRRRFCECEKELMAASGMKASYVVLMLGPTSSGKTMYLIALHKALRMDGGYILPPRGTGASPLAQLYVTVLAGGGSGDTSLRKMSNDLFDHGKLPYSTFSLDNEPLVLDVHVDFRTGQSNSALLFLRDLPGEFLSNLDRTVELDRIAAQFPKFDGFIMMLDPFTFENRQVFIPDGNADTTDKEKLKFIENLNEVITGKIIVFFGGRKIEKPTAVIITKSDHFFNRNNIQRLEYAGVKRNFPSLTQWQKVTFDSEYFREVDIDVYRILSNLSSNIVKMIDRNFGNTFCGLVSALNKVPLALEFRQNGELGPGDYVMVPNAINPWRVADPFIRLLMKLKIVPPFDELEIRRPDLERYENLLARNSRYLATINNWGRTYCNAWMDVAGQLLEQGMQQSQPQPQQNPYPNEDPGSQWVQQGLCRYCGSNQIGGLFTKKCKVCGGTQ